MERKGDKDVKGILLESIGSACFIRGDNQGPGRFLVTSDRRKRSFGGSLAKTCVAARPHNLLVGAIVANGKVMSFVFLEKL